MEDKKTVTVKLEKHLWPDEIEQRKRQKGKAMVKILVVLMIIASFGIGYCLGNKKPEKSMVASVTTTKQDSFSYTKLKLVNSILAKDWYFGEDTDPFNENLVEKAILGMVNNETDIHTSYMTKEEAEEFTTSIDMGFVGIGVQFTTAENMNMVTRVFADSPAERAGVQAGDIIYKVDGIVVEDAQSDEIASLVKGEEGSHVKITFLRQNEEVELDIIRGKVENSAYGEMITDEIGYLEIYQFGSTTSNVIKSYLDSLTQQGMHKLIIDLRDNGGGYLLSLVDIASFFLPKDTVCIQQEYRDGTVEVSKTTGGNYESIDQIVILINGNTASASEVLAMALKEQRNDVTIIGTTSYGKGTVQISRPFTDGTTLKYTTSRWLTPLGNWVNGVGIIPDEEVALHEILYNAVYTFPEDMVFHNDEVSEFIRVAQLALDMLGYDVKRTDGYFDSSTLSSLISFQRSINLTNEGVLDTDTYEALISRVSMEWSLNKELYDTQLNRAVEILNTESGAVSFQKRYNQIQVEGALSDLRFFYALEESLLRKEHFGI